MVTSRRIKYMIYASAFAVALILVTFHAAIKYSFAWSGPEKIGGTMVPGYEILPSHLVRIVEKENNQFYGLFGSSEYSYYLSKTNDLTEWTEEFKPAAHLFEEYREMDWASGVDYSHLNLLNNKSLLFSGLFIEISEYYSPGYPFIEFLQSNDSVVWSSAISTNNWTHMPFNNRSYWVQGYSVLQKTNEVKILTYYIDDNYPHSEINDLNLAVWRLNTSIDGVMLVRESNYTYYAKDVWGVGDDFAINNKHILFSQSDSLDNREGLIVTYENETWSFNTFLFPYSEGYMKTMIWEDGELFLIYNAPYGFNPFKGTPVLVHICKIVPNQYTNTSSIQDVKRIGRCEGDYSDVIAVRGVDQKKIIFQNNGWFLYEERFDVSQLLIYSFSTTGLILLAVLPLIIQRIKRKNLEKVDNKLNQ